MKFTKYYSVDEVGCELGFWIASKFWKRGIATEASKTMLYFGFKQLS
jgi:RimJ/RimL family protein N-acetyltransferase